MLIAMAVHDTVENKRTWMTEETLFSLAKTVDWSEHRLIISDNGSCEKTLELYKTALEEFPQEGLWIIYNGKNLGTARAINKAWQHRKPGEHAVKMDNDVTICQPGWADWMEDVFGRDPSIGICGLKRNDLAESPTSEGDMKSTLRMLPHEQGERWLVVEEVRHVMGTCQGFSSALLDKIGYLTQPGLYGFDDGLASARCEAAGFEKVFLLGIEINHIDPGAKDDYLIWKRREANRYWPVFATQRALLESGVMPYFDDGGFD